MSCGFFTSDIIHIAFLFTGFVLTLLYQIGKRHLLGEAAHIAAELFPQTAVDRITQLVRLIVGAEIVG